MQLLISVANASEAEAAREGGADLVDAKDPSAGALGAVSLETLREICGAVDDARPVTAALGDASEEGAIERAAFDYASAGAVFVKIGFESIASQARTAALTAAAVSGAREGSRGRCGVVAVAYADAWRETALARTALIDVAARAGAVGVLLDTADKNGPGLPGLIDPRTLHGWVATAHEAGLLVALAGRLSAHDLPRVRDTGADIAGVRGAACDGGRTGQVTAARVRQLRMHIQGG